MFKFLLKGVFRDRHRWLMPIIVSMAGVSILVASFSFLGGYQLSYERQTSRFTSGHLKVVSRAYAEMLDLKPYDLSLLNIEDDLRKWKNMYPQFTWAERINFGALIDIPDSLGTTREQGDVVGFAVDLFSDDSEVKRLQLETSLKSGYLPEKSGEILLTDLAAEKLEVDVGSEITLIGSTVFGAMSMMNFQVVGTIEFGIQSLDKGAVVADLNDIREMMDMQNGAGEILLFFPDNEYHHQEAREISHAFNQRYSNPDDEFSPKMLTMMEQGNIGYMMSTFDSALLMMALSFILVLGIVLWNSGLINSIRRYGEFGLRLAIGESKRQVYLTLLVEALFTGLVGSILGLLVGSLGMLYFNIYGLDMSVYNQTGNILTENILYAKFSFQSLMLSFIPGVLSSLLGASLAGIAIFKRQTSQLFKELET